MSRFILVRISQFLNKLDVALAQIFRGPFQSPQPAILGINPNSHIGSTKNDSKYGLRDLIGDGILWAVPKHRRTIERRLSRKFGYPEYNWKPLKLKTHLRSCNNCGHDHEIGVLCPNCYAKVRTETQLMQDKIQEKLGLNPVEQEVIVLYEGEKHEQPSEFLDGKRIVEMEKPRPNWFSKNLIQKTTQKPATTKEAKPSDLG
ncbi:39S ribosomal protein L32, mitochondrial [Eupeodes corollae]|uniref:39S ribosomal protein L32, mitochondrial n=1 Tax=Eupeodes corollae TaxID=290404 RepID=UPI00248F8D7E|nr:39S ribosomal protein L32, mitochondrial [Eupeodes corollae]